MDAPKISKWFHERLGPSEWRVHEVKTVLFSKKTPFQHIEIVELGDYGRSLILDGKVQSTQSDEFIYHEVLVHPAMLVHPNPKRVMVIGGGEGGTPREVLRHRSVERALMGGIYRQVIEGSPAMLPEFHAGGLPEWGQGGRPGGTRCYSPRQDARPENPGRVKFLARGGLHPQDCAAKTPAAPPGQRDPPHRGRRAALYLSRSRPRPLRNFPRILVIEDEAKVASLLIGS